MKALLEEDPSELMELEEEDDSMDLTGSEDEEDEPRGLMGLGEEDDEEDDSADSDDDDESAELLGLDDEDDDEEEEEGPQIVRHPGLRPAAGRRAKRRARLIAVAALKARRRARVYHAALMDACTEHLSVLEMTLIAAAEQNPGTEAAASRSGETAERKRSTKHQQT